MDELELLLSEYNADIAQGRMTPAEADRILQEDIGMTRAQLGQAVQAQLFERMATEHQAAAERDRRPAMTTADALRLEAQGATFGLGDELAGLAAALVPGGKGYGEAVAGSRERVGRLREDYPIASTALETIGGIGAGVTGGAALPGVGSRILGGAGASVGRQIAGAAAGGALAGAATGAGEGEGLLGRAQGAGVGGVIGGVAGGGIGLLGVPVRAAASKIPGLRRFVPSRGQAAATREISDAGERAGLAPDELQRIFGELSEQRPGIVTPADLDPQFAATARGALQDATGEARDVVEAVTQRTGAAGSRQAADLRRIVSPNQTIREARESAATRQSEAGTRLFKPLEEAHPSLERTPRLASVLDDPEVAPIWGRIRGDNETPSFTEVQRLRQKMQQKIESLRNQGDTFGANELKELRGELTDTIDELVPGFRSANQEFAQVASIGRAFDDGGNAFKFSPDIVQSQMDDLAESAGEFGEDALTAYRLGIADNLSRRLGARSTNRSVSKFLVQMGDENKDVLRLAFPDDETFQSFMQRAGVDAQLSELGSLRLGGTRAPAGGVSVAQALRDPRGAAAASLGRVSPKVARERSNAILQTLLGQGDENMDAFLRTLESRPDVVSQALPVGLAVPAASRGTGLLNRQER